MKRPHMRWPREHYALILGQDNRYKLQPLDGGKSLKTFPFREHKYLVEPKRSWRLTGWRPLRREHPLSDIMAYDGVRRFLAIYAEPEGKRESAVEPLDRLALGFDGGQITPLIWKAWSKSTLYRARMRKLKVGGGNLRLVLFMLIAVVVILVVMMFTRYFGG